MLYTATVNTTGSDGSATGSVTLGSEIGMLPQGDKVKFLWAVKVDYHASAPATTDLTISEDGGLGRTLLTLSNRNTDGVFYPRVQVQDTAGSDSGQYEPIVLSAPLKIEVAQCNQLTGAVAVTVQLVRSENLIR